MKPVVWGVLSVSKHFKLRVHTNVSKSPLIQLQGLASRSKDKAAEAARELGIRKAYGSYEELLADKEIEAVYIPLPNHLHAEWVKKAADAGKHVLCEKPFAMNAEEAEEAIRHAERKGVLVMEAFMYRFHPQWKTGARDREGGRDREVHSVSTLFSYMLNTIPDEHPEHPGRRRRGHPRHRLLRGLQRPVPDRHGACARGQPRAARPGS